MRKLIDLTGRKFNRWLVLKQIGVKENRRIWECICDCGAIKHLPTSLVYIVKSCGCLQKEAAIASILKRGVKPYRTERRIWRGIRDRCINPKSTHYHDYGGRGIKMCDSWLHSFDNFIKDMGPRPSNKHTIERIENDGDYELGNCKWATRKQQANNRRSNRLFEYNGISQTMQEIIDQTGIKKSTFKSRVYMGWTLDKIINTPIQEHKK